MTSSWKKWQKIHSALEQSSALYVILPPCADPVTEELYSYLGNVDTCSRTMKKDILRLQASTFSNTSPIS